MSEEIITIHIPMKGPSRSKPGGESVTGHYRVEDDFVVMCKPDGLPIELNGKRFRRKFGTKSGELCRARGGANDDARRSDMN